ncbi:MAG: hypothetical protein AUJ47_00490 [Candidatus Marinimicrobia bacterium CG1_02_48_14]|nr:MAG: hypothetical protein AUJ47_00490 [Candidatus Marinimicrobia bacterium CG1_02_48_14]
MEFSMPLEISRLERFPRSILVLAPHPDDFDAMGVTLKYFYEHGSEIHLAVVSSGVSGVDDDFCDPPTPKNKARVREREQLASCGFFGLPENLVSFLHLKEDDTHHPVNSPENLARIRSHFLKIHPDTVFLPHGNDKNTTHRLTHAFFQQAVNGLNFPVTGYLNRDPKTIAMCPDLYLPFDETQAQWKAELLRHHASQQQRNLSSRGYGFDERILKLNRQIAEELGISEPYAEVFEIEQMFDTTSKKGGA